MTRGDIQAVESTIEQVTVYASGARVRRVATVRAPVPAVVRFVGLPLTVLDGTIRTEVDGPGIVSAIRAGIDTPDAEAAAAEQPAEVRAAHRRVTLAESEVERLETALARLEDVPLVEDDPSDDPPAAWTTIVAARRALVTLRAGRALGLREGLAAAKRELDAAKLALEVAAEHERRAGSARAARLHELRKHVELDVAAQGDVTIRVEYQVAAARWAPTYVARLDGEQARVELRAVVAQDSGEDWLGVALRLSTAEPERFAELPELAPQKIGRRQHEPARRGFRPPPTGADTLYLDYDRGFPKRARSAGFTTTAVLDDSTFEGRVPEAPEVPAPQAEQQSQPHRFPRAPSGFEQENWDEESSRAKAFEPAPTPFPHARRRGGGIASAVGGAMAGVVAAPIMAAASLAKRAPTSRAEAAAAATPAAMAPTPRLDYGNLRMAAPHATARGRLVPNAPTGLDAEVASRIASATTAIAELELPDGCDDDWVHTYDYAFAGDGKVDVRADAAWHSLALTARAGTAKLRHVAVPREQPDVFRVAAIANPFDGPLLPGPIDVYDRGQFLVTSELDYTPPGATVDIGLGVDPSVKIARNVEFHEEATGMLRGALKLVHAITIDVENLSPRPVDIEVRERVPVAREGDDDIEVTIGKVEPAWERWTPDPDAPRDARLRGGYCWKLAVPPTSKKLVRAGYEVKIAGKLELVGGNRREP
jgi:hypothetical protein